MSKARFPHYLLPLALLALCLSLSLNSYAQKWSKEPLMGNDKAYLQKQREAVNDLAQRNFGRSLNGKRSNDFPIMQRLLNEKVIKPEQTQILQAMGVILGDNLKAEQRLNWIIYIDRYGRSRALNIPGQRDVVFPITMISRRFETGLDVDIERVYQKAIESVEQIKKQIVVY
ncbi:MAG: hypothetical protein ACJA0N_002246 [Pseudohongiellaceae bacterium]|jgi:hypothetical protein